MQEEFKRCWPDIKNSKRVEIHINSYSIAELKRMTVEKLKQKENSQVTRIFTVKDPNVDVMRLLQLADLDLEKYSQDDILSCVTNRVQVDDAINNPRNMYKGPNGPVLAAIKI